MVAELPRRMGGEVWARTGRPYSVHAQSWPQWDADLAREEEITLVVQVNGKVRDRIQVEAGIDEGRAKELALASPLAQKYLDGKPVRRVIYVPGKLVNIVVG